MCSRVGVYGNLKHFLSHVHVLSQRRTDTETLNEILISQWLACNQRNTVSFDLESHLDLRPTSLRKGRLRLQRVT